MASQHKLKAAGPTLDEITNRVFEELLQGKGTENSHASDHGSIKVQNLKKFSTFFAMHHFAWVNEKCKQHFCWKPQDKYH